MKRILVVYHSRNGNTEAMARAVHEGAASVEGVEATLMRAADATAEDLTGCDGLALGSPEYFGYMAGMLKDFFDRTYEDARGSVFRLPWVAFVSAGNDGTGAVNSMERIARGYQFRMVQDPLIVRGPAADDDLARCREVGMALAAGLSLGIY